MDVCHFLYIAEMYRTKLIKNEMMAKGFLFVKNISNFVAGHSINYNMY